MPQLSVLMPVRDGARWIAASIDSVLAQTFSDFELIIVDDGSRDATSRIVAGYAARDPRISVIPQPPSGLVAALNNGLAAAKAPLLARLDADDIAAPTRFAEQTEAMSRNPRLAVLGSWATEIDETGQARGARHPTTNAASLARELRSGNPMIHSAVMMRTDMVRAAGGYRGAFAAAEDYDLWLRLSETGEIANLPCALAHYRVHSGSVTAQRILTQLLSTRLAQRSAQLRHLRTADPADGRDAPFDLWAEPPPDYAEAFLIFRLLAWSDPASIPPAFKTVTPDFRKLAGAKLSRRERLYAQKAILRYLDDHPNGLRANLLMQCIALRPLRAIPLVWRHLVSRKGIVVA